MKLLEASGVQCIVVRNDIRSNLQFQETINARHDCHQPPKLLNILPFSPIIMEVENYPPHVNERKQQKLEIHPWTPRKTMIMGEKKYPCGRKETTELPASVEYVFVGAILPHNMVIFFH